MTDQSIFGNQSATTDAPQSLQGDTQQQQPSPSLPIPEEAADFIGEGKKYKDVTTALAALAPAQNHIKALEDEMAEIRAELAKRKSVEDAVGSLMDSTKEQQADTPATGLDESTVDKLIDERLKAKTLKETSEANEAKVVAALSSKFKDKAQEMYVAKAQELGMSITDLNTLVHKSPQAALNLFGITTTQTQSNASMSSSLNSVALDNDTNRVGKGYAYYKELRKTNPRMYTKLYPQMQAEALEAERKGIDYFKTI